MTWSPIILTFELALVTSFILFLLALPLSYWLAHTKSKIRPLVATLVSMPLVLPPTVIGFYLLILFSPQNAFGSWLEESIGLRLVFSFPGLVIASVIYSLPFMVHPLQSGLSSLPTSLSEASYVLGKSKLTTFLKIQLPNIKKSIWTGLILTFAHTIGEFGIVLMMGGNIPGETRVASIAIYDEVEALNYTHAHYYAIILFSLTFGILFLVHLMNGRLIKHERT